MSRLPKIAWSFIQLSFVALSSPIYIPLRLARKFPRCDKGAWNLWWFREMYEHPFSKFINHTTWYLLFLAVAFSSSFEEAFGTTVTGLLSIGKSNADHIHHRLSSSLLSSSVSPSSSILFLFPVVFFLFVSLPPDSRTLSS